MEVNLPVHPEDSTLKSGEAITGWNLGRIQPTPSHVPKGWALLRLTSVARLESGHTPSRRRPDYWNGDIPWISLHDSTHLDVAEITCTQQTIGELGLANSSARLLPKGTVVFSRTATVGKATIMGREMATSQDFANFVCGNRLHNSFLMHLFRFLEPEWARLMAGSTLNTIYMPVFRDLQVLLPPLSEQRAIAAALGDVDALIGVLDWLIAKKRDLKQAAMQQLLTGQTRLPGFHGEWEVGHIQDIAEVKTGPFGSALHERDYVVDGTPIITVEHLDEFGVSHSNLPMVSDADRQRLKAYSLEEDDIVFSRVGSIDRNALIRTAEAGWLFSGRLLRLRLNRRRVFAPYLSYQFHTELFKTRVRNVAVGQTMPCLNTHILNSIEVVIPPLPEQTAIAAVLSDMDAEIAALEARRDKTRLLKQGMMQELLIGKTRLV